MGSLLLVLSVLLALIAVWSALMLGLGDGKEKYAAEALGFAALIGAVAGFVTVRVAGASGQMGRREALLLVALSWIVGAALSGLPFYAWAFIVELQTGVRHAFYSPVNAYFEAMSGLTTTGATILENIADPNEPGVVLPRSLLLWRSLTHWLGGLGIVVLFVAVLPSLGAGGKRLYKVEAPGPRAEGVTPNIRETARVLWLIYLGLTAAEIVALRISGMDWFNSFCHTFATLATGGFSTHNASMAGANSAAAEWIVVVFMLLAGINFGLYYMLIRGRWKKALADTELRVYLGIMAVAALLVTVAIYNRPITTTAGEQLTGTAGEAVRYGVFQVVSIQTTTGFGTADFDRWPFIAQAVLICLMFIGGSAGSTGGGLKVMRIWMMFKVLAAEVEKAFRPNVVRSMKVGTAPVDADLRLGTIGYILSMVLIMAAGGVALQVFESFGDSGATFRTTGTASIACLFNIGPGLGLVGATENYAWFTDASKLLMSLLMAIGRLELFAIIVLFSPRYWRGD